MGVRKAGTVWAPLVIAVAVAGVLNGMTLAAAASPPFVEVSLHLPSSLNNLETSINDAACPSPTRCYLAGGGTTGPGGKGFLAAFVVRTSDGGASWTTTVLPGQTEEAVAISCATSLRCVVMGSPSIAFVTTDGGTTWSMHDLPSGADITSVSCPTAQQCIAVGNNSAGAGYGFVTQDDGATWSALSMPGAAAAVRCLDTTHCWVSGAGVWFSADLGATWTDESPPDPPCPPGQQVCDVYYSNLPDIEFQSPDDGYVVGGDQCGGPAQNATQCSGALFHTNDGGATWTIWQGSVQQPFGWQISCRRSPCLYATDIGTVRTVLYTGSGSSWSKTQTLPFVTYALACTPNGVFCVDGGAAGNVAALYESGAAMPGVSSQNGGGGSESTFLNGAQSAVASAAATPSLLTSAPLTAVINAVLVLALVLLITFPAHLFNRTYEENRDVIRAWWERRAPWLSRIRTATHTFGRTRRGLAFATVIAVGAVLGALLDPGFGANARTLALILGFALALLFVIGVNAAAAAMYRRQQRAPLRWHLHALPSALLVAGLGVLVSRLLNFQPGYLYGVIGGVAFATVLDRRRAGRETAVACLAMLIVAVVAWLAWVPVSSVASGARAGFGWALFQDFLAAIFVTGLVGLLISLIPLRFLPGERILSWHRGAWAVVFAVTAFALLEIMLRPQSAGAHVDGAPFWTTLGLFVAFGTASLLFWGYFRVRHAAHPLVARRTD